MIKRMILYILISMKILNGTNIHNIASYIYIYIYRKDDTLRKFNLKFDLLVLENILEGC